MRNPHFDQKLLDELASLTSEVDNVILVLLRAISTAEIALRAAEAAEYAVNATQNSGTEVKEAKGTAKAATDAVRRAVDAVKLVEEATGNLERWVYLARQRTGDTTEAERE